MTEQTKEQKLVELLEALAIKAEYLARQARGLKPVLQTEYPLTHKALQDWKTAAWNLSSYTSRFEKWVYLDTLEVEDFLLQQIKDQDKNGIEY